MNVKKGEPLGHPDNIGKGDADPQQAGAEGGSGFLGDQRQPTARNDRKNSKEPPLDGTMSSEDIEGDTDKERPGAH